MQTLNDDIIGQTVFFCRINRFCFCCHARGRFGHGTLGLWVTSHEPHKALRALGTEDGIAKRRVLKLDRRFSDFRYDKCLAILQIDSIAYGIRKSVRLLRVQNALNLITETGNLGKRSVIHPTVRLIP